MILEFCYHVIHSTNLKNLNKNPKNLKTFPDKT